LVNGLHFNNIRGDIHGGLTAAVVALPLALAFGVASGAGPLAGIYGAIFVGFFASLFGGTPAQVSGPTGPMTVVMTGIIIQFADRPAMAFTVVVLAGLFQILFGIMKIGRYINLMPFPVISGFMSGIGVIIIVLQLSPLVGQMTPKDSIPNVIAALPAAFANASFDATAVGIASLAIMYLWPARLQRVVPAPLVALLLGAVTVYFLLPGTPILGEIPTGLPQPVVPIFDFAALPDIVSGALVLALLGSIDSLLTSLIADSVTGGYHDSDRELIGQGIGNTIAGLFGAIPGAGATMRTVVNVRAGGRTPLSGALHALVLLAVVLGLAALAKFIPHAVLAGILVKVGIDIIDWGYIKRCWHAPRAGVLFMVIVLLLTVFVDLITAVAVGIVLASLLFVKRMSDLQLESINMITSETEEHSLTDEEAEILAQADGRVVIYEMGGPFSFGVARGMARLLGAADQYGALVLDMSNVPMVDSSAGLALQDVIQQAVSLDKPVIVVGMCPRVLETLTQLGVIRLLAPERMPATRVVALKLAAELTK
jgi:sulfate permease, SulP family